MAIFEDVLLITDFDCTLTDPYTRIPQRNLDAIAFFTENGGKFTVNTGRCVDDFSEFLDKLPINAPVLMCCGSVRWEEGHVSGVKNIDLPVWQTLGRIAREFPDINIVIQGSESVYLIEPSAELMKSYDARGEHYVVAENGQEIGPFIKFSIIGNPKADEAASLFDIDDQEKARFDSVEARINQLCGDKVVTYRYAPGLIDVQAKGVSKGSAARELQSDLGRRILVCVGDGAPDMPMLDEADYGFCPADAGIADRYSNVCSCAEGAIADVIYKRIPEILGIRLDKI